MIDRLPDVRRLLKEVGIRDGPTYIYINRYIVQQVIVLEDDARAAAPTHAR